MSNNEIKTITVKKYTNDDKKIWDDFVDKSKNGLFIFKRNFMDYHSDRFQDNSLIFYEDEKIIAILPLSIKNNELFSHGGLTFGGFIIDERMKQHKMIECFKELLKYMKTNCITKLQYKCIPYIYHKLAAEEDLYSLYRINAKIIKIEPSCIIMLNKPIIMTKGRKAQISKAKREGVIIETSEDFESFINLENYVLKKYHNTTAVHTAEELKLLKSRFQDEIQLYTVKYNGKIIASVLLFIYGDTIHTQYMAADETGRELGALDLIIKTIIDKFHDNKNFIDFGISSENSGLYLNEGLINQKESFGARVICYQTWEISETDYNCN